MVALLAFVTFGAGTGKPLDFSLPATALAFAPDRGFAIGDESGIVTEFGADAKPGISFIDYA